MTGKRRPSKVQAAVSSLMRRPAITRVNSRYINRIDGFVRRVTRGRVSSVSGWFYDECVLHSLGAKSGQWRENTLLYATDDAGVPYVVGTNFGGDSHPAWTHNLLANPGARLVVKGQERPVTAVRLTPEEMAPMWPRFDAVYPGYADYRQRIGDSRQVRMFRLDAA